MFTENLIIYPVITTKKYIGRFIYIIANAKNRTVYTKYNKRAQYKYTAFSTMPLHTVFPLYKTKYILLIQSKIDIALQ